MKVPAAPVVLVVLLLVPGVSHALTPKQEALVGLKGMEVIVEDTGPEAENLDLTKAKIQTDVEMRLRKAGVRVLTKNERFKTPGMPYLYVNVNARIKQGLPLVVFSVIVDLKEKVTLARGFETYGAIWDCSSSGAAGVGDIRAIRAFVGDRVDEFINDYLAANPN